VSYRFATLGTLAIVACGRVDFDLLSHGGRPFDGGAGDATPASIQLVQKSSFTATPAGTSASVALSQPQAATDTIVVYVWSWAMPTSTFSNTAIADTGGNTYAQAITSCAGGQAAIAIASPFTFDSGATMTSRASGCSSWSTGHAASRWRQTSSTRLRRVIRSSNPRTCCGRGRAPRLTASAHQADRSHDAVIMAAWAGSRLPW